MAAAYPPYIMRDPSTQTYKRGVAQPGSAPPWGGGGRRFKSSRPDQSGYLCAPFPVSGFVSPSATHTCGWLTHESPVIPAKRGEAELSRTHLMCVRAAERVQRVLLRPGQQQALNGIARVTRDSQKLCAGGSAPAPWVTFFARAKKVTKESTPPDGATASLCFSPESALASTRRARTTRLGLKHEARFSRFRLRCSGAPYGVEKNPVI